jgi:hypothetical protein
VEFIAPYGFLGLEISTATAESGWRPGFLYINSLFIFESNIVLSLIIILYLYMNSSFPHRNQIRDALKEGKSDRKPYPPMVSEIQKNNHSMKKTQVCS